MKSTVESLSSLSRKLNVEIPAAVVAGAFDRMYQDIQKEVTLKGFRKGKAPMPQIRSMYGDRVKQDVAQNLIQMHYGKALSEHKLEPLTNAEFEFEDPSEIGGDFKFSATFDIRPRKAPVNEAFVATILEAIGPGPNGRAWDCRACGFPTCRRFAEAASEGRATLLQCTPYQVRRADEAQRQAAVDSLTGLATYRVLRDRLAAEIEQRPGVAMAAPFGTSLHVCGLDPVALRTAVQPWADRIAFTPAEPSLEDVFIHLMRGATDNSVSAV